MNMTIDMMMIILSMRNDEYLMHDMNMMVDIYTDMDMYTEKYGCNIYWLIWDWFEMGYEFTYGWNVYVTSEWHSNLHNEKCGLLYIWIDMEIDITMTMWWLTHVWKCHMNYVTVLATQVTG